MGVGETAAPAAPTLTEDAETGASAAAEGTDDSGGASPVADARGSASDDDIRR